MELIVRGDPTRRKILTADQLIAAIHEWSASLPAIRLFIHEALEHTVQALRESTASSPSVATSAVRRRK